MKLLLLSDKECSSLWDYYTPGKLKGYDLILSCGDLKAEYLSFLVTMANVPLLYVRGNHDLRYDEYPPEGCTCIEDKLYIHNGLRILGLGGSPRYSGGPNQYTERQMKRRINKMALKIRRAGGVDIVLSHASATGYGDANDYAHRGFDCFLDMLEKYRPAYLIHGHVHLNYGYNIPRVLKLNDTQIINAYDHYELEI